MMVKAELEEADTAPAEVELGDPNEAELGDVSETELDGVNELELEEADGLKLGDADEGTGVTVVVRTTELVTVDEEEETTEGKLIEEDLSTVMVLLAVE